MKALVSCFLVLACMASCLNKRCDNAFKEARKQNRDTTLMYIWHRVIYISKYDSGYVSFKPNGDYLSSISMKYLNGVGGVWHTSGNTLIRTQCSEFTPHHMDCKYKVQNDTLILWADQPYPDKYIKVLKY